MELRIGVVHSPKELSLELDSSADDVVQLIDDGLAAGKPMVWVTDTRGRRVGLPADKIAYVEVDDGNGGRHVGFGR
jgi:hypothetical protein